jgi:hypothetical protein
MGLWKITLYQMDTPFGGIVLWHWLALFRTFSGAQIALVTLAMVLARTCLKVLPQQVRRTHMAKAGAVASFFPPARRQGSAARSTRHISLGYGPKASAIRTGSFRDTRSGSGRRCNVTAPDIPTNSRRLWIGQSHANRQQMSPSACACPRNQNSISNDIPNRPRITWGGFLLFASRSLRPRHDRAYVPDGLC